MPRIYFTKGTKILSKNCPLTISPSWNVFSVFQQLSAFQASGQASASVLSTLMLMANDVDEGLQPDGGPVKAKTVEYEGRGTVPCTLW
jgi:hypothetical protein